MTGRLHWPERGDTLIEVVIALTILSAVITSAYVVANRAFLSGQTAKERSALVSSAQQQAEALRSFRDEHTWAEFRDGNAALGYMGVVNAQQASADCYTPTVAVDHCFHMEQVTLSGILRWVPRPGNIDASTFTPGYVNIGIRDTLAIGHLDCLIFYGNDALGGGSNNGTLIVNLTDLDGLL